MNNAIEVLTDLQSSRENAREKEKLNGTIKPVEVLLKFKQRRTGATFDDRCRPNRDLERFATLHLQWSMRVRG